MHLVQINEQSPRFQYQLPNSFWAAPTVMKNIQTDGKSVWKIWCCFWTIHSQKRPYSVRSISSTSISILEKIEALWLPGKCHNPLVYKNIWRKIYFKGNVFIRLQGAQARAAQELSWGTQGSFWRVFVAGFCCRQAVAVQTRTWGAWCHLGWVSDHEYIMMFC